MLQCVTAGSHSEPLLVDQAKALKAELMMLNQLCDEGKKAVLFKEWNSKWNADSFEESHEERLNHQSILKMHYFLYDSSLQLWEQTSMWGAASHVMHTCLQERISELTDLSKKGELLTKVLKNVVNGLAKEWGTTLESRWLVESWFVVLLAHPIPPKKSHN